MLDLTDPMNVNRSAVSLSISRWVSPVLSDGICPANMRSFVMNACSCQTLKRPAKRNTFENINIVQWIGVKRSQNKDECFRKKPEVLLAVRMTKRVGDMRTHLQHADSEHSALFCSRACTGCLTVRRMSLGLWPCGRERLLRRHFCLQVLERVDVF